MISGIFYFLCAAGTVVLVVHKFRSWIAAPPEQRPAILPVCTSGIFVAAGFLVAVPIVGVNLNWLTGIPSLSVIVLGVTTMAWVASGQTMLLYWRHSPDRAWRIARWIIAIYGVIAVAQVTLFILGGPPADLHLEFLVVYPAAPFFGEQMALHFLSYTVGMVSLAYMCWKWSTEQTTVGRVWLRRGLRFTAAGFLVAVGFGAVTFVSIIATWFDLDWSLLSTKVGPTLNILSAPLVIVGMSIPVWGPKLPGSLQRLAGYPAAYRAYRRLRPLWQALLPIDTAMVHPYRSVADRFQFDLRLLWRMIEINDWLQVLQPYRAAPVAAAISERLDTTGLTRTRVLSLQEAAEIQAALATYRRGNPSVDASARPVHGATEPAHHAFASERAYLLSIASVFHDRRVHDALAAIPGLTEPVPASVVTSP
ncbi:MULTISPECIES: MAB_1171c family putative transporter [unclassified Crossiella]|uniref:MAB_1171c family putative transporter n=1 Tax=unclassified Crossiella TaxID=2620835 RepID=UPI001FFF3513|nr:MULTISPECIES: MAB_1171c family putative transporter [unclassified Crossiella]MCK2243706.1 hypothetical protein [Crossiella sp. S99.2]MCK2257565.1 hypothetical protein [Crossiella sp. S99.1]